MRLLPLLAVPEHLSELLPEGCSVFSLTPNSGASLGWQAEAAALDMVELVGKGVPMKPLFRTWACFFLATNRCLGRRLL